MKTTTTANRSGGERRLTPLGDERGLSLIEMLVAAALSLVLIGVVVTLLVTAMQAQPKLAERNADIQRGRVLQEQLTRELRLTYGLTAATPSSITFDTFLGRSSCGGAPSAGADKIQCRVTYSCDAGTCTRGEGAVSGGVVSSRTLVTGISNSSSVFSYQPVSTPLTSITFVGVQLVFPADDSGEDSITLSDGTALRNR